MDVYQLLLMIRRFRWLYLIIFFSTAIISGYLMVPKILIYKGETTFYMANESLIDPNLFGRQVNQDPLQVSVSQERILQLAYSAEMMSHIIEKFNLYKHYEIDTNYIYHYELAVNTLTGNMKIDKITPDISRISITDRNNEIAAAIANAIVWNLDELNKKYLNNKLQTNLSFYEAFINESSKISNNQNEKLDRYMNQLFESENRVNSDLTPELEYGIYNAVSKIHEVTEKVIMAKNLYLNAANLRESKNLPSIVIIKKAIPDFETKRHILFLAAGIAGVLSCLIFLTVSYIVASYNRELQIIFGAKLPVENKKQSNS